MADKTSESACPVDHKARDAWLAQARASEASKAQPAQCPVDHKSPAPTSQSWTQTFGSYLPWSSSSSPSQPVPSAAVSAHDGLGTDRVISTIPRTSGPAACPVEHGASANAEIESGAHESGNWVYPSEKMFFEAMKRKGYDARETDMKTVVPIHNAVNERAWHEIQKWEKPYLAESKSVQPCSNQFIHPSYMLIAF